MAHKPQPKLTLHELIGALSYWGTAARVMLGSVVMGVAYLMNVTFDRTPAFFETETMLLIFGLGALFVFDFCYVMVARAKNIRRPTTDRITVMLVDMLITILYLIPSLAVVTTGAALGFRYALAGIVLLGLSIRILIGFLYSTRK